MAELSPDARRVLARLLDTATYRPAIHDRGDVFIDAPEPGNPGRHERIAADVPRSAWVELIAATGRPDDVYAANGARIGRLVGTIDGAPIVADVDD